MDRRDRRACRPALSRQYFRRLAAQILETGGERVAAAAAAIERRGCGGAGGALLVVVMHRLVRRPSLLGRAAAPDADHGLGGVDADLAEKIGELVDAGDRLADRRIDEQ